MKNCPHCGGALAPSKREKPQGSTPDPARPDWHLWPPVLCADGVLRQFGATFPCKRGHKPKHIKPYGRDWLPAYLEALPKGIAIENRINAPAPTCGDDDKARQERIKLIRKIFN